MLLARRNWLTKTFQPAILAKFEASYEIAQSVGDKFSFLKREHMVVEEGILVMPPKDHALKLAELLGVKPRKISKVPCGKEILSQDDTAPLDSVRASAYRSAVGVGLYISNDRPDICFTVRILAQWLCGPTELAWRCAQKLAAYLQHTTGYGTLIVAGATGESVTAPGREGATNLLETCTDSDWSGNKRNRRSMSSASYFVNGTCVFTTCRTQKVVTLSSSEAEYYSLVSGAADSIFIKAVVSFMTGEHFDLVLRLDNQAAKQLSLKQGCGRIRHIDGRYLWLQEKTADGTLKVRSIDGELNARTALRGSELCFSCMAWWTTEIWSLRELENPKWMKLRRE